jgi:betaine lipid synthase
LPFGIDLQVQPLYAGLVIAVLGGIALSRLSSRSKADGDNAPGLFRSFFLFFYSSFLKPHQGDSKANQQDALESFYKKQAGAYDSTRKVLLRGREDMLGLVVAQLKSKVEQATAAGKNHNKRIWVDVSARTSPKRQLNA